MRLDAFHRRLARRLWDSETGLCEVDTQGIVEHIDGGALGAVGASRREWIGASILPAYEVPFRAALSGQTCIFTEPDPQTGKRRTLVRYEPRFDESGDIDGVIIWWFVVPKGFSIVVQESPDE